MTTGSVTSVPATAVALRGRGVNSRRRARLNVWRGIVFVFLGIFFLTPLYAMAEFTTRGVGNAPRNLDAWRQIVTYPDLIGAISISLELAVITSISMLVLLLPTMIWARLRLPRLQRIVEYICLLPLTIPGIVLVVGLAPIYKWVSYFFGDSSLTLAFAYLILVLPYTFRAIQSGLSAIDVTTLSEAARSLGASWATVMWRVIVPNVRAALLNAALLSVALVLGEFTIAQLLNYQNLQVAINLLGRANAGVSIAVALASLLLAFVLLLVLSFVGGHRGRTGDEG